MCPSSSTSTADRPSASGEWAISSSEIIWPTEVELLLACGRLRVTDAQVRRIREILQGDLDWNRLFRLAILHCLTPFLFRHLDTSARDLVPETTIQYLRNRFLQDGAAALRNTSQLLDLIEMFEQRGVLAVPYKGPALAMYLYGNVAFRRCNDLDILISRDDVPQARALLEKAGFAPLHPTTPASRNFLLQKRHSEIFKGDPGVFIELHWAFAKQRGLFPLDLDMLRPRLQEMTLAGSRVKMFSPDDQLLILCVHGANHLWSRLEWLCGIAELIRNDSLEWHIVLERAEKLYSTKALFLGLLLAEELLDAPVPEEVHLKVRSSRDVNWAAHLVKKKLAAGQIERPEERSSLERDLFRLRLQSTNRARISYVMHRITIPGRDDTRLMLPVGRRFIPLPSFLRPFHILGRLMGTILQRPTSDDIDLKNR